MHTDESKHTDPSRDEQGKRVEVELNGAKKHIAAGEYTGSALKKILGVPIEHELDQVVHHEFKEIANDAKVRVKGGEKYVSHCGQGQSS